MSKLGSVEHGPDGNIDWQPLTITVEPHPADQGGGFSATVFIKGKRWSSHLRTNVAAALAAVTVDIHDLIDPYED